MRADGVALDGDSLSLQLSARRPGFRRENREPWQVLALRLAGRIHGRMSSDAATKALLTAVMEASGAAVVQQLLNAGASVLAVDDGESRRPLLHVCASSDVARLLIAAGADVTQVDAHGATALHASALCDPYADELRPLLVEAGADVNARNSRGSTPLHDAVLRFASSALDFSDVGAVMELLALGADPSIADHEGRTPLEEMLAMMRGFPAADWLDEVSTADIKHWCALALRLAADSGWYRRRHLLLAVRGRYSLVPPDDTTAAGGVDADVDLQMPVKLARPVVSC